MDQSYLKTSWKQRVAIILIAVLLLGITVATYMGLVLSGNSSSKSTSSTETDPELAEIEERYNAKAAELSKLDEELSAKYLEEFKGFRSSVKAFNEAAANEASVETEDLKEGDGTEITEEWRDYYAYYIGYCADEDVFQSSFDDFDDPTSLSEPISGDQDMIAGWTQGVLGMKVGGARQITMPGELAYGESREMCGGTNKPLRFVVMAIEPGEEYRKLANELNEIVAEYNAKLVNQY